VSGGIDKDVIRRVVRAHINEVRYCYNQGLVGDPNLKGRVAVQFTIGATGKVPLAVVQESSVNDRNVGNCIAKAVRRWRFPKPENSGLVMVTYPFVLTPAGR
jgi:TonB family protein